MFTLVHNLRRYPRSDSRAIQGLVLLHGFDIPLADGARFDMTRAALEHSAKAVGIPLITVATNVRELYHGIDWLVFAHGPALMMVALSLAGGFHTMYVPSAHPFLDLIPLGTHPALDPHWSTEAIEVVHADGEFPRTVKIIRLAAQPDLLAGLRVCWSNVGTEYNCGRCEKCLRTMMTLGLNGLSRWHPGFPH